MLTLLGSSVWALLLGTFSFGLVVWDRSLRISRVGSFLVFSLFFYGFSWFFKELDLKELDLKELDLKELDFKELDIH